MKNLIVSSFYTLCICLPLLGQAQIDQQLKSPIDNKVILKKGKLKNSKIFLTKDIVMSTFDLDMNKATRRGSGSNTNYLIPFRIILKNKGIAKTGMFYLCTYINDYHHPHSGDGWWARETTIKEKIRIVKASGKNVKWHNFNTLRISELNAGQTIMITGMLQVRQNIINHYHITAVADCNSAATTYYSSHGRVKETDEFNNKKGVMPRK